MYLGTKTYLMTSKIQKCNQFRETGIFLRTYLQKQLGTYTIWGKKKSQKKVTTKVRANLNDAFDTPDSMLHDYNM